MEPGIRIMILDIKRACFIREVEDDIYIELLDEDAKKKEGSVGLLKKAMYGTRAAPQVWQEVVRRRMVSLGLSPSIESPCV